MKLLLAIVVLVLCVVTLSAKQTSFEGFKVWLVSAERGEQMDQLAELQQSESIDFWEPLGHEHIRVMVAPDTQEQFLDFLASSGIENELIIDNVERTLEKERIDDMKYRLQKKMTPKSNASNVDFNHFWSLEEMHEYLDFLEREHSDLVSTEVIGNSTEGRPLRLVNISLNGRGIVDGSRPIIFIDSGIHAREWAAHMSSFYIINQLVENRARYQIILEAVDFVILPEINPDGYQYSRDADRLWRKTRTPFGINEIGRICYGTDGNRNYPHMWRSAVETRVTTCNETYPGAEPFSEPETRAMKFVLDRHQTAVKVYITIHTYGNYVLYPWGFARHLIGNWQLHDMIGHIYADNIYRATRTRYTVGNAAIALYPAYGDSVDYAAFVGVETGFTVELPGGGRYGFDLPAERLQSVMEETWIGFSKVFQFAGLTTWSNNYY